MRSVITLPLGSFDGAGGTTLVGVASARITGGSPLLVPRRVGAIGEGAGGAEHRQRGNDADRQKHRRGGGSALLRCGAY